MRWGIVGLGGIAEVFAAQLAGSATGVVGGAASRSPEKAVAFASRYPGCRPFGGDDGYVRLLADPSIDCVYIATPHTEHSRGCIAAARAGKHILCEKPLAPTLADAEAAVDAARHAGVFLMEAFMYRCHPQTAKLAELVAGGAVGDVALIEASFCFRHDYSPESRLHRRELGGGGILDVGCYCLSMVRMLAGAALGLGASAEPQEMAGIGVLGALSGVDEVAAASLRFAGDIVAQVSTSTRVSHENAVRVYGSGGSIWVRNPWLPGDQRAGAEALVTGGISVTLQGGRSTHLLPPDPRPLYAIEADLVAACVSEGRTEPPFPAMGWADSLGNAAAVEQWLAQVGY